MKKWIRKSLVRKLNNFKGLTPANVHRVETTTITFLNDNRIVKICTIKDDEVILIPKKISNVMISSRFFAIRDILKNFFNQKSM